MRGRALVVDPDRGNRAEVETLLSRLGLEVDGAEAAPSALAAIDGAPPDVVVLDVDFGGLELCREIIEHSERTAVILISAAQTSSTERVAGLLAGADDYVCAPYDPDELLARVRRTMARQAPVQRSQPVRKLSPREQEVLALLASGQNQGEIASTLVISQKTVGSHVEHILGKLGVHSRAEAVAYALGGGASEANAAPQPARGPVDTTDPGR
jgi:two-component system, NarL family, nitrate/nitrite response regulator NarL